MLALTAEVDIFTPAHLKTFLSDVQMLLLITLVSQRPRRKEPDREGNPVQDF